MNPPHGGFHNQAAQIEAMTKRDAEDAARAAAAVSETETENGKAVSVSDPKPLPEPPVDKPAEEIPGAPAIPIADPPVTEPPAV